MASMDRETSFVAMPWLRWLEETASMPMYPRNGPERWGSSFETMAPIMRDCGGGGMVVVLGSVDVMLVEGLLSRARKQRSGH